MSTVFNILFECVSMLVSSKQKVQLRLMSVVQQISGHKPKHWTNLNVDLMMALDEMLEDHQNYYNSS